ncbi:MAG: STAS domain-containing protein [Patescibacteria group bacterium]|jgi:anti-sigma B factor antagonist
MAPCTLDKYETGGVVVITIDGTMEYENVVGVGDYIKAVLSAGTKKVIVDLGTTTRANSKGLGSLISAKKAANETGAQIILLNPNASVEQLLVTTQLTQIFPIHHATVEEAIKLFK